ncbi:MAG: ABC transporter permease [Acidobacteria bacterium]|nr:ABC transporter permease [Acidobacteriota bacterium]
MGAAYAGDRARNGAPEPGIARERQRSTAVDWKRLLPRLRGWRSRNARQGELRDEIRSHIEHQAEEYEFHGMPSAEARRKALAEFGSIAVALEDSRDAWRFPAVDSILADLKFGWRVLWKAPGFAIVAVLTLALGIGANTAVFTVVNGVLLRPLPYPAPERLYALDASKPNFPRGSISFPNFLDWQARNRVFSALALFRGTSFILAAGGEPERVRGAWITADYFSLLGVAPVLGRNFLPGEDAIGGPPLALMNETLWRRKFGARADVLGSAITLDDRRFTIIGIVPSSFDLLQVNFAAPEIYVPLGAWPNGALRLRAAGLGLHGLARLKPGVTAGQARADMERVTRELGSEFPDVDRGVGATLTPLEEAVVGAVRPTLVFLFAAVGFVLLIACVNVASLLLARSAARVREFAVRTALGARRRRMIRQLVTESLILGATGGAAGLAMSLWLTRAGLAALPQALPRVQQVHVDGYVLAFACGISIFSGVLFGLAPAFRMAAHSMQAGLALGRGAAGRRLRTHRALVVVEIATALLLLIGAGLSLRSLMRLWQVDPGFDSRNLVVFNIELPPAMRAAPAATVMAEWRELHRALNATPGAVAASLRDGSTPFGGDDELLFWKAGEPHPASASEMNWALRYDVTPEYLRAMGIPLLRGRFFTPQENNKTPTAVVVDDVFAATFFSGQQAIGKRIHWEGLYGPGQEASKPVVEGEIVGIVGHVKHWGLETDDRQQLRAQAYLNIWQTPDNGASSNLGAAVRTAASPAAVIDALRESMRRVDAEALPYGFRTMESVIEQSLRTRRFSMMLLGAFAAIALLLASIGIYGVASYLVRERTQEIGVRMALGARPATVLRMILGEGLQLAGAGLLLGMIAAVPGVRAIRSLLFATRAADPLTFVLVAAVLLLVALAAAFIPAWRATRIDPMLALRCE